jgi:hypothetical protein
MTEPYFTDVTGKLWVGPDREGSDVMLRISPMSDEVMEDLSFQGITYHFRSPKDARELAEDLRAIADEAEGNSNA